MISPRNLFASRRTGPRRRSGSAIRRHSGDAQRIRGMVVKTRREGRQAPGQVGDTDRGYARQFDFQGLVVDDRQRATLAGPS